MVKVSVVLPVYDCVRYFRKAIESLGAQTFQDFEVVIIDDCCYDGTEKIIDIYAQLPNVRVLRHPNNMGLGESLNDGLAMATGDYIAIQHGDDISLPLRFEREVQYLDSHPNVYLVSTWMQYIDENDKPKKKDGWWLRQVKSVNDNPVEIKDMMLKTNCMVHTSVMFRKEVFGSVGFYDPDMVPAEDYDYFLRISEKHDLGIVREVLVQYRVHSAQISNTEGGVKMVSKAAIAVTRAKLRRGL